MKVDGDRGLTSAGAVSLGCKAIVSLIVSLILPLTR